MIKISWAITDNIENISLKEFNTEWNGIYGYFEIRINDRILGFCPDRKLLAGEEGNEDILYWLSILSTGIMQLDTDRKYEIQLLSMNLIKIILNKSDKLLISLVNSSTDEIIWFEKIMIQEWYDEVMLNIDRFIAEVQKLNSALLEADLVKNLLNQRKS